jgi:outer membrane protein OmpA-like peptidoglycan-associated protein
MNTVSSRRHKLTAGLLIGALGLTALPSAHAMETQTKQELTAIGAVAVATAAAGPVGLVAGIFGGSWLASKVKDADDYVVAAAELQEVETALAAANLELESLELELAGARESQQRFARMALDQLQLEMLFKTGDSALTSGGIDRLNMLATFLAKNPDVDVEITGYADPRGGSQANMALSKARAQRVADQLSAQGIQTSRLQVSALGESESLADEGDHDAYALERRVHIALQQRNDGSHLASVSLNGE